MCTQWCGKFKVVPYTKYVVLNLDDSVFVDGSIGVYRMNDLIGSCKSNVQCSSASDTCVTVFGGSTFVISCVQLYTCFNFIGRKNPLKPVNTMAIFYWLKESGKRRLEAEFDELLSTIFPLFSTPVKWPIDMQTGGFSLKINYFFKFCRLNKKCT